MNPHPVRRRRPNHFVYRRENALQPLFAFAQCLFGLLETVVALRFAHNRNQFSRFKNSEAEKVSPRSGAGI
jgi:hypothetical protein